MKKLRLFFLFSLALYYFMANSSAPVAAQGLYQCSTSGVTCTPIDNCVSPYVPGPCTLNPMTVVCEPDTPTGCVSATPTPTPPPPTPGTYYCTYSSTTGKCVVTRNCSFGYKPGSCGLIPVPGGGLCTPTVAVPGACVPATTVTVAPLTITPQLCNPAPFGGLNSGIQTALGCVPTQLQGIVPWLLRTIAGIAGGIALLLLFYGGVMYILAGGDPKAIDEAKGIITAAVSGLLLIIFSVLILRIIGINVLGIPAIQPGPGNGINVPGS